MDNIAKITLTFKLEPHVKKMKGLHLSTATLSSSADIGAVEYCVP